MNPQREEENIDIFKVVAMGVFDETNQRESSERIEFVVCPSPGIT